MMTYFGPRFIKNTIDRSQFYAAGPKYYDDINRSHLTNIAEIMLFRSLIAMASGCCLTSSTPLSK